MAGVVHVQWYATILRQDALATEIADVSRLALRYGASQYAVHRSRDDRYRITQMAWFEDKADWYRYWDGPEMVEFRRRNSRNYQIPLAYIWQDEIAAGSLGPAVELDAAPEPEPTPEPQAAGS